jgi:hypothetical protein
MAGASIGPSMMPVTHLVIPDRTIRCIVGEDGLKAYVEERKVVDPKFKASNLRQLFGWNESGSAANPREE